MKLVLYSGGSEEANKDLNLKVLKLVGKENPKLTFIPSSSYDAEIDFKFFVKEFQTLGVERFMYFCVDLPFTKTLLKEVLDSDLIFLGGGNTFYFLKFLKMNKMFTHFKKFLKRGGVLCGLSAGAIVLTPHVHTATFPDFDRDENIFSMKNLNAGKFVNFEFFPHYRNSLRYEKEMIKYSKKSLLPLFALTDGSGLIVEDNCLTIHGGCRIFQHGRMINLSKLP